MNVTNQQEPRIPTNQPMCRADAVTSFAQNDVTMHRTDIHKKTTRNHSFRIKPNDIFI